MTFRGPLISTSLPTIGPASSTRCWNLVGSMASSFSGLQAVSSCRDSEGPATKGASIRFRGRLHPPEPHHVRTGGGQRVFVLPRSIALLRMLPVPKPDSKQIPSPFSRMACYATTYYLAGRLYRSRYPNYRHHKPFEIYPEAWYWIRSGLRKAWFKLSERNVQARLSGSLAKSSSWSRCRYQRQPSQASQRLSQRPRFHCTGSQFVCAFGAGRLLPRVQASSDGSWSSSLRKADIGSGGRGRPRWQGDVHPRPTFADFAQGCARVVVINSTVGLSALLHGAAVKVLGRCIYDLED